MTYTLTICYGMFLAICGQIRHFDFPDRESCEHERAAQLKRVGDVIVTGKQIGRAHV